jgi:hypothetical protein
MSVLLKVILETIQYDFFISALSPVNISKLKYVTKSKKEIKNVVKNETKIIITQVCLFYFRTRYILNNFLQKLCVEGKPGC